MAVRGRKPIAPLTQTAENVKLAAIVARHKIRVQRLERRAMRFGYEPRRLLRPNLKALKQLGAEIASLPKRKRIRAEQARQLLKMIERLARRQRRIDTLVTHALHRQAQIYHRTRVGEFMHRQLAMTNGWDRLLGFLIERRGNGGRGGNVHATALALKRSVMLPPGQLAEWGRKGAQVRWAKREVVTAGAEPIANPPEFSATEVPAASAPV